MGPRSFVMSQDHTSLGRRAINSGFFFTVYKQYVIELYPTVMRGMAIGAFGVVERVGGALAPQLILLNVFWEGAAYTAALIIVATSFVLGAIILPETGR